MASQRVNGGKPIKQAGVFSWTRLLVNVALLPVTSYITCCCLLFSILFLMAVFIYFLLKYIPNYYNYNYFQ